MISSHLKAELRRHEALVTTVKKVRAARKKVRAARSEIVTQAWRTLSPSDMRVIDGLPMFVPASAGARRDLARLGLQSANETFPLLTRLISEAGRQLERPIPVEDLVNTEAKRAAAEQLETLFRRFGSDKATTHYHLFYGSILSEPGAIRAMFEVGLGTPNTRLVSHMGRTGQPGASLRAFREFLPNANVYGADVDRSILFSEDRIETFFVDQTEPDTFAALAGRLPGGLDLIIDDGLHSPSANLATVLFGLGKLAPGGWLVIEDIPYQALPVWQVVAALLPEGVIARVVEARWDLLFTVTRPAQI